jgi:cell wall-associated NlpC family hydrolase
MQYLGIPYKWGAASPSAGFDCSGLTMYVFNQVGVSLPHYAAAQYGLGVAVSKDQLQPGDLVFFRGLGHMGMYIGGGNMIHAPRTGDVVKISSIYESYYVANWVGARRVL